MGRADKALYAAKALGRNQVQVGVELTTSSLEEVSGRGQIIEFLQGLADEAEGRNHGDEHGEAMARWVTVVARELGLPREAERRCSLAARFHDVGKVGAPASILAKPGPLDAEEWTIVRQHPATGARILTGAPELASIACVVACHHERWDGRGYPAGRRGEDIPIEARIIAVCDSWAAMRADRPYRAALPREAARAEIRDKAGTQFDPAVAEAFLRAEATGLLELHGGMRHAA